jgi:outer membrane protein OmpA-like peptidoglycan-associated protein
MKFILGSLIFFILPINAFSKESVIIGNLIGSGQYLESQDGNTYPLKHSDLSRELMDLSGKKIRMLCRIQDGECEPLRYELSPFYTENDLQKWTLKPIPKYVYRSMTSFNPTVTPDGHILFWTVLVENGNSNTQKIWYSTLDENGFWKKGIEMSAPLNNQAPSAVIAAMPGGNELFVFGTYGDQDTFKQMKKKLDSEKMELLKSSKSPKEFEQNYSKLKAEYRTDLDKLMNRVPLYKSVKMGNGWSTPESINFPDFYNLYRSDDNPNLQVFGGSALSSSGRVLIYSAKHKDSVGKLDLYVSIMDDNNVFPLGKNLGRSINTEYEEMAPFLATDDRTLYFASNGHNGLSVYVTQRQGDSWMNWSVPQEISKNIKGSNFFSIPASGNWAYLSRQGALYMTFLPKEVKPNPVILVKGKVKDNNGNPLSADITYESLTTKQKIGNTVSDPNTGTFSIVLPYGENYGFYAQKKNYMSAHNHTDLRELQSSYKEVEVELVLPKIEVGEEMIIKNLFFESNRSDIKKESEPELDRLGKILLDNMDIEVLIEGHTDNVGKNEDNLALSLGRANSVAQYLMKNHKIHPDRLKVAGHGEELPLFPNDSPENRSKNRRVVFKILKKASK